MVVFGGVSSAGIFDDKAKLILALALLMANFDERMANQVLDDVAGCGPERDGTVEHFYNAYRKVADTIGV